jgi:tripartite-type tricarboxylate transporter receptor subunit TctC
MKHHQKKTDVSPTADLERRKTIRRIAQTVSGLASMSLLPNLWAQGTAAKGAWPNQPIRMISPWTAGSGTDIIARLIAEKLSTELGVPVIVEPRPGAAGNIGSALAANQPADGNTLLVTSASFAISPAIYRNLSYDPVKDFVPVTKLATAPLLVLVRADSPLRTMADLIALTKKDPKSVNYGSFGNGSPSHLIGESINRLAGISMTHVPYSTGGAPLDLLGGRLTVAILDALSQTPQIKAGKMRALALNGLNRLPSIPDVPTLVESGIPFDTVGWQAVFAPAGVPPEIIEKLNRTLNQILATAVVQTQIHAVGCFPVTPPTTAAQWADMFKKDVQTWADLVKRSGAKID